MIRLAADPEGIQRAVGILRDDGVVAYPTETVYGLAVNPLSHAALHALFLVKGRPENNPILLVVSSEQQMLPLVREITSAHRACMAAFWPGPLSLLFDPSDVLPAPITAGSGKVCIRHTAHPVARKLCDAWGGAVTSTSANRSGRPPARSPEEMKLAGVALVLDGGLLPPSPPSTVYDPTTRRILRQGAIPESEIESALNRS